MKQITFKELKELCGCVTNNEFANMLSIYMDAESEAVKKRGHYECAKLMRRRSNKIYTKLQELGYYADLEGGK